MDQHSIVLYLAKNGLQATEMHRDLEDTLGPKTIASSIMALPLRAPSFFAANEVQEDQGEAAQVGEVDEAILKALADEPFSPARALARHTWLTRTTVHRHLQR
jgi:hypothetical protein